MSEATSSFAVAVAVFILLVDLWAIVSVFRTVKANHTSAMTASPLKRSEAPLGAL